MSENLEKTVLLRNINQKPRILDREEWREILLREMVLRYGNVEKIWVLYPKNITQRNKLIAFVQFYSTVDAHKCLNDRSIGVKENGHRDRITIEQAYNEIKSVDALVFKKTAQFEQNPNTIDNLNDGVYTFDSENGGYPQSVPFPNPQQMRPPMSMPPPSLTQVNLNAILEKFRQMQNVPQGAGHYMNNYTITPEELQSIMQNAILRKQNEKDDKKDPQV
jgi:hypothetical protein